MQSSKELKIINSLHYIKIIEFLEVKVSHSPTNHTL